MTGVDELAEAVEGHFWDPEDEMRRVRGRVLWPRRTPQLALEEPLRPAPGGAHPLQSIQALGRQTAETIAGVSLVGEPLCLQGCFVMQMSGARVTHPQLWSADRIYLGTDAPPSAVTGLEVELLGLSDFYGSPSLGELTPTPEGTRDRITVDWFSSPKLQAPFGPLTVSFEDDMTVAGPLQRLTLTATPRMHLSAPHARPLDDLRPQVGYLAALVGFCRGAAVELDVLWVLTADDKRVRCLERLRPLAEHAPDSSHTWLGIGNLHPLPRTLDRWHAFCFANENAVSMIAQYLRDPPQNMTIDRLLVLVRFIEEYAHTARLSGAMSAKKNEFHKVLRYFMKRQAGALGAAMGEHGGQAFPQAVADTRNYHTHFNPQLAAKAADGRDLIILIDRLWLLTRAIVLHELGYDDNEVAEKLSLDPRTSWLAAQP